MDKDMGLFGFVLACVFFKVFFKLVFIWKYINLMILDVFFINVGVRVSLRAPQLIPRALKLMTM